LKLQGIVDGWDSKTKVEKMILFRQKKKIENDVNSSLQEVNKQAGSNLNDNYLEEFNKTINNFYNNKIFSEKILELMEIISEMQQQVNKYCEEVEKNGEIPNKNERSGNNIDQLEKLPITPKQIPYIDPIRPIPDKTPSITPTPKPTLDLCPPKDNSKYQFFITYKARSQEVLVLDPSKELDKAQTVKLDDESFVDGRIPNFPPEYSKYINIGDGILITGGIQNGNAINNCYFLQISKGKDGSLSALVTNFTNMSEKRERHNVIYLDHPTSNQKEVLVCGGFYSTTAEKTKLLDQHWTTISPMKYSRANATMLYYNQKTVYCFGGFNVSDKQISGNAGNYISTCEFIDVHIPGASWNCFELDNLFKVNLKFCAMGVIQLNPSRFLLVGGYDGSKYLNDVHELHIEGTISKAVHVGKNNKLGRGVIFPSSSKFVQWGNHFYNFDFANKIVQYDANSNDFLVR
jgi:hypothetical protein